MPRGGYQRHRMQPKSLLRTIKARRERRHRRDQREYEGPSDYHRRDELSNYQRQDEQPNYHHDGQGSNYHRYEDNKNEVVEDNGVDFSEQQDRRMHAAARSYHDIERSSEYYDVGDEDDEQVYVVRQAYGYLSIMFSLAQTGILAAMMWQCGVAPLELNPMIGPYPDALSYWGGKNAFLILDQGENWRLLSPIMLHAGVLHLLGNVAVQIDAGAFFEREWGSGTWLFVYLSSAIGSSMLSCIVMPDYVSVGSSGAVCGLFGAKLAEWFCRFCESTKTAQGRIGYEVRQEQCRGVFCSLIIVGLFSFVPFVDWGAHLGGMLAGMAVGILVFSCTIKTICFKIFWFLVGLVMTVFSFGAAARYMYGGGIVPMEDLQDVCGYYKQFFDEYECNCQIENRGGN